MATPPYYRAGSAIPVLSLGFVVLATSYLLNTGILITKKTTYRAASLITAAVCNLGLDYYLIPRFGMMGAAWATTISFIILAIATWVGSQLVYPIHYDLKRVFSLALVAIGIFWVAQLLPDNPLWLNMLLRLGLVCSFPLVLFGLRFFSKREIDALRQSLNRLKERGNSIRVPWPSVGR
jgi:O-antigen/teichoic acid export membrane protein